MTVHHVGVGGLAAVADPSDALRTLALGSCVAIVMLEPVRRCVGMAHVALPDSAVNVERAISLPGYFVDTAIPNLLEAMASRGATDRRSLMVKLIGGASVISASSSFDIGRRNVLAIKRILWTRQMGAIAEDVGGKISRTVQVDAVSGRIRISSPGREDWEI